MAVPKPNWHKIVDRLPKRRRLHTKKFFIAVLKVAVRFVLRHLNKFPKRLSLVSPDLGFQHLLEKVTFNNI